MVVVSKAERNITDDIVLLMQLENLDRIYHKQKTEIGRYLRYCTTAEIMEISCSVLLPPKITATLVFMILSLSFKVYLR